MRNGTAKYRPAVMKLSSLSASFWGERKGASESAREKTGRRWTLTMQATGASTLICSVDQTFPETVRSLRAALEQEGIKVPVEIDASARLRGTFAAELRPCRVICVDCPITLLPAAVVDAALIGLFPLHVVVTSERAVESSIYLTTPPSTGLNDGLRLAYERFSGRVLRIICRVAGTGLRSGASR